MTFRVPGSLRTEGKIVMTCMSVTILTQKKRWIKKRSVVLYK